MNRRQRRLRARLNQLAMVGPPLLVALLWLVGLALPSRHREVATVWLPSTPEAVWSVLTDLEGMPNWRQDLVSLERLPNGLGTIRWREVGVSETAAFERIEAVPPSLLVVRLADAQAPTRQWTYRITAMNRGAELAVTEEQYISNPLRRTLVGVFGADRGRLSRLERDLAKRLTVRHEYAARAAR